MDIQQQQQHFTWFRCLHLPLSLRVIYLLYLNWHRYRMARLRKWEILIILQERLFKFFDANKPNKKKKIMKNRRNDTKRNVTLTWNYLMDYRMVCCFLTSWHDAEYATIAPIARYVWFFSSNWIRVSCNCSQAQFKCKCADKNPHTCEIDTFCVTSRRCD